MKKENGNVKGFATVVFGDSFKITNIAIVENKDKDQLFVSMPRYKRYLRFVFFCITMKIKVFEKISPILNPFAKSVVYIV